jgi:hypothetical protein
MVTSIRSSFQRGLLLVCAALAVASTARGDLISVQVTGEVTYSDFDTIGVGTPVTGLYTYDPDTLSVVGDPGHAWYSPITTAMSFVGGSSASSGDGEIYVANNVGPGLSDVYGVIIVVCNSYITG